MDNEKYGIELELLTDNFTKQVQKIKQQSKEIQSAFDPNKTNFKITIDGKGAIQGFKTLNNSLKGQAQQLSSVYERQRQQIKSLGTEATITAQKVNSVSYKRYDASSIQQAVDSYSKADQKIEKTTNSTTKLNNETKKVGTSASIMSAGIGKSLTKMSNSISAGMNKLKNSVSRTFSKMTSKIRRFGLSLLSIRSIFALVSRASSAYLSQNEALSEKIQNTWVKLGALLAPIIERIVNLIDRAVNFIAKFIQGLTGINLLAKISAKSIGKTTSAVKALNKALAGFDELTNLDTETGGGTGTGEAGGVSFGSDDFDDYMNGILEAIRNADWEEVGGLLGEKLNYALENIPWDKIKNGAKTLGENLAKTINGFIAKTKWETVGKTLAEGINTVTELAAGFIRTFKFDELGKAIGDTINGFFKNVKWEDVASVLSDGIKGVLNGITSILETVDWVTIGKSIATFLAGLDYVGIATSVVKGVAAAFKGVKDIGEGLGVGLASSLIKGIFGVDVPEKGVKEGIDTWFSGAEKIALDTLTQGNVLFKLGGLIAKGIKRGIKEEPLTSEELQEKLGLSEEELKTLSTDVTSSINGKIDNLKLHFVNIQAKISTKKSEIKENAEKLVNGVKNLKVKVASKISTTKKKLQEDANNLIKKVKPSNLTVALKIEAKLSEFKTFWNNKIAAPINKIFPNAIPQLAVGTNYVPQDQLAMIHKGEAVIPKKFNSKQYFSNDNPETNAKLDAVIEAINNIEINPYTTIKDVGKASLNYINNKSRQLGESVVV